MSRSQESGPLSGLPIQARQVPSDYYMDSNLVKTYPKQIKLRGQESRKGCRLCRELGEPLRKDVKRRQEDCLRTQRSVRFKLHDDPRRVVRRLHGLDLVLLHELLAHLAVRREYEGLFVFRRRGLHVALADREVRMRRVQRLAPCLQDRIVHASHAARRSPLRSILPPT